MPMKTLLNIVLAILALTMINAHSFSASRKILVEMQTSTTCSPCYAADVYYFQSWLPNYGGAEQIVTLAYHVWWPTPGNDPIYLSNATHVQGRVQFYSGGGSTFAPRAYIDGFVDGGSSYTSWPGAIESRFLDPAPISITLTGSRNGSTLNLNAAINADRVVNSSSWRVHWAVVESGLSVPQNSPSGYVPFVHEYAHRSMYPDHNGTAITISQGQTVNMPQAITLNNEWIANKCRVIVFIQNTTDKKIQNVEYVDVPMLTSVGEPVHGVPTIFEVSQNYPNPFNPSTKIDYAVSKQSFVTLKVYNMLGQEVRTLVSGEQNVGVHTEIWDGIDNWGSAVPSGIYFYTMTAENFSQTRKMIFLK
jgi:hypothetical protein